MDPADYNRGLITGATEIAPAANLTLAMTRSDGRTEAFPAAHTLNGGQSHWFRASSLLNKGNSETGVPPRTHELALRSLSDLYARHGQWSSARPFTPASELFS